ncbi:MAG: mannose-1-phosphate guanylyltransferase [Terriglobia bacterium]
MIYAVILAGGRGTRFWPQSRIAEPKQLLKILTDRSLLQQSVDRIAPLIPPGNIFVLGNRILRDSIREQLPEVPPDQIIAEPVGHNTAPCIGLAAHLIAQRDPEAVLVVLPSDQIITRRELFLDCLRAAEVVARKNENIVVLGLKPTRPETGFGYVQVEEPGVPQGSGMKVHVVERFVEKPDRPTAERYLAKGNFYWNGGIFIWKASTVIAATARFLPATDKALTEIAARAKAGFLDGALEEWYPRTDSISVDYGIMEKAGSIFCVASDIGWSDLGSWEALYEVLEKDSSGNILKGNCITLDARGNLIDVPDKLVALIGVKDLIIVQTEDALLICDRNRSQEVSKLVKELEQRGLKELL